MHTTAFGLQAISRQTTVLLTVASSVRKAVLYSTEVRSGERPISQLLQGPLNPCPPTNASASASLGKYRPRPPGHWQPVNAAHKYSNRAWNSCKNAPTASLPRHPPMARNPEPEPDVAVHHKRQAWRMVKHLPRLNFAVSLPTADRSPSRSWTWLPSAREVETKRPPRPARCHDEYSSALDFPAAATATITRSGSLARASYLEVLRTNERRPGRAPRGQLSTPPWSPGSERICPIDAAALGSCRRRRQALLLLQATRSPDATASAEG